MPLCVLCGRRDVWFRRCCLLACGCVVLFGGLELGVGSWDVVDEGGGMCGEVGGCFLGAGRGWFGGGMGEGEGG